MKYKVGDSVVIKGGLEVGETYGSDSFESEMAEFRGCVALITDIVGDKYTIDLDGGAWWWTDEMFVEKVNPNDAEPVDIGYYLDYCGHKIIKNVFYGGYAYDTEHVFCTTVNGKNQYTLPKNSIEFIIPHEREV